MYQRMPCNEMRCIFRTSTEMFLLPLCHYQTSHWGITRAATSFSFIPTHNKYYSGRGEVTARLCNIIIKIFTS